MEMGKSMIMKRYGRGGWKHIIEWLIEQWGDIRRRSKGAG